MPVAPRSGPAELPRVIANPLPLRAAVLLLAVAACSPPDPGARGTECIAPANPGGGWDLTCRAVGRILERMELAPGHVRTVNMPGAGGGVAFAHAVTRRRGDPTLLVAASPATTLRLAQGQYGHLSEDDVRWVGAVGAEYGILAVARDAPWERLEDLLRVWRTDPGSVVVAGGSPVAGQDHMKVLLLARRAGADPLKIRYVPFDGGGEAMTALLGGFVHVFSGEASEVEGQLEAGSLRVLTVLAPERVEGRLGQVPTAREAGIDLDWVTWRGFYAPPGIPDSTYARWVDALTRMGRSDAWAEARRESRLRPYFRAGPEFEAFVQEQVGEFRSLARELGLIR